jgi:hypothetical protein
MAHIQAPLQTRTRRDFSRAASPWNSMLKPCCGMRSWFHSEPTGRLSIEQLYAMLGAIAEVSSKLPNLPTSAFTRESLYDDRP